MLSISNTTPSTFSILRAHYNTIVYSESAISYSARFSSDSTVARSSSCSSFACSLCANRSMTSTLLHSAHAQRARPRAPLACVLSVPRRVERLLRLDQARERDRRLISTLTFRLAFSESLSSERRRRGGDCAKAPEIREGRGSATAIGARKHAEGCAPACSSARSFALFFAKNSVAAIFSTPSQ